MMIFITVGSQKFQFDRLIATIDNLVADGTINDEVFAQIGHCVYEPVNIQFERFLSREKFTEMLTVSSLVITHAGTGVIVNALKNGKKVLAMPRLAEFGEHVDDHQIQLLSQFGDAGLIEVANDERSLRDAYIRCLDKKYVPFTSTNELFVADLDQYLSKVN